MTLHRCRCNAVSNPAIATHAGDFKSMKFHQDPNNPNELICDDCFQSLEDVNSEWMDQDDDYFNSFQGEYDDEEEDEDDEV